MSLHVATLKSRYQELLAPGDDAKFLRLLNEAEERLQEGAKWEWTVTEADVTYQAGYITVPRDTYSSLLGVIIDDRGRVLRRRDVEFIPGGIGRLDLNDALGFLVDAGVSGGNRRYKVMVSSGDDLPTDEAESATLRGLLHLAHTELSTPGDTTLCPSANALKLAMYACVYEEANDLERSEVFWAKAAQRLDEYEATYRGGVRPAAPVIQPFGDGIDPIPTII